MQKLLKHCSVTFCLRLIKIMLDFRFSSPLSSILITVMIQMKVLNLLGGISKIVQQFNIIQRLLCWLIQWEKIYIPKGSMARTKFVWAWLPVGHHTDVTCDCSDTSPSISTHSLPLCTQITKEWSNLVFNITGSLHKSVIWYNN